MTNLELVIFYSRKANSLFYVNKREASQYLGEVLKLTFNNPVFLAEIPDESAGEVGQAYLNILDLIDEPKFFQTLSTLSYYFISRGLKKDLNNCRLLEKRIVTLNLGAQTFWRTVAKAKNMSCPYHVNYSDWQNLPIVVKYVLILEYRDACKLQTLALLPHDMLMRKIWLDTSVENGYFDDVCPVDRIVDFASILHNDIMAYLDDEIIRKGTYLFS